MLLLLLSLPLLCSCISVGTNQLFTHSHKYICFLEVKQSRLEYGYCTRSHLGPCNAVCWLRNVLARHKLSQPSRSPPTSKPGLPCKHVCCLCSCCHTSPGRPYRTTSSLHDSHTDSVSGLQRHQISCLQRRRPSLFLYILPGCSQMPCQLQSVVRAT